MQRIEIFLDAHLLDLKAAASLTNEQPLAFEHQQRVTHRGPRHVQAVRKAALRHDIAGARLSPLNHLEDFLIGLQGKPFIWRVQHCAPLAVAPDPAGGMMNCGIRNPTSSPYAIRIPVGDEWHTRTFDPPICSLCLPVMALLAARTDISSDGPLLNVGPRALFGRGMGEPCNLAETDSRQPTAWA